MIIRQSDLASYARCPQQKHLYDEAREGRVKRPSNLSGTVYGTVMHHALQTLERLHSEGNPDTLAIAKSTFVHYWMPEGIVDLGNLGGHPELVHGIDEWLPRQSYGGLRIKGLRCLDDYYELLRTDTGKLLALELDFLVDVDLSEYGIGHHQVKGTLDRLALRKYQKSWYLSIEDFKTGKQQTYLRYNNQFTVYSWASLQPDFWLPWGADANDRWQEFLPLARRGRWFNVSENKPHDAGWRAEADYSRMKLALAEYVKANNHDVFPLSLSGATCLYCDFRDGTCGGVPVPDEDEGRPR